MIQGIPRSKSSSNQPTGRQVRTERSGAIFQLRSATNRPLLSFARHGRRNQGMPHVADDEARGYHERQSAPPELVEKSFLAFLGGSDLIRPLLTGKEIKPSKLDELQARLAEVEKQAAKLAKLICDDPDPSPTIYSKLRHEESRCNQLRADPEQEQMRELAEKPAIIAYNQFKAVLPELVKDAFRRPELRRAIASVVTKIVLDPHGNGDGTWDYETTLKGTSEPVNVRIVSKPEGWCCRSVKPAQYIKPGAVEQARQRLAGFPSY
jgi:hypothetical protein